MPVSIHGHLPARLLGAELPFFLEQGLPPEIAFGWRDLEQLTPDILSGYGRQLASAGLTPTVHAPFHDLNPGALDPEITAVTHRRLEQTLHAAARLGARLVVVHPGFDRWRYQGLEQLWIDASVDFWSRFLPLAQEQGCLLVLENIFDQQPEPLATLLDLLDSPWLGHCFDIGHWHLFSSTPLAAWFARLGSRLRHLHLHDNHGQADDHLPVGAGRIDFAELARLLPGLRQPFSITCEAHRREDLLPSIAAVRRFLP